MNKPFNPDWVSCPGETICSILEERKIPYSAFFIVMGMDNEFGMRFLNGKEVLTKEIAEKLEKIVGSTKEFWLRREWTYRKMLRKNGMKMTKNYKKLVKVIEKTQEFLKTHRWVRHQEAVDKDGDIVFPKSKGACAWCVLGALVKCSNESVANEINNEYNAYNGCYLECFNDEQARDKRDVIRELTKLKKFINGGNQAIFVEHYRKG